MNPEGEVICLACRASLTGGSSTPVQPGASGGAKCPNGHPIDPSWTSCPYCTRTASPSPGGPMKSTLVEDGPPGAIPPGASTPTRLEDGPAPAVPASGGRRTSLEGEPSSPPAPPPGLRATRMEDSAPSAPRPFAPGPAPGGLRATRLEEPTPPTGRRTVLDPVSQPTLLTPSPPPRTTPAPAQAASAASQRELVAVLAAPKVRPGGEVFAVRAGKNTLGAAPGSDVQLSLDDQVSGEHALLLFRGGSFYLSDRMSTNGTWVNDQEVDPTHPAVVIRDRDRIRCGRTEMIFLILNVPRDDEQDLE